MKRTLILALGASFVLLVASTAGAQDWPAYSGDPLSRGPGFYLAWWKLLLYWLVFICWVCSTDWINRDSQEIGPGIQMPHTVWNPIVVFSFLAAFLIAGMLIPIFFAGFAVVLLAYIVPLMIYIFMRNARVVSDQKVLTPSHIKEYFANFGRRGRRKQKQVKMAYEEGPPVEIQAIAAPTGPENQSNLIQARQSEGYVTAKELIADLFARGAERAMLDYTQESVAVRYEIDGVWHNVDPRDRESSDVMLAILKLICNLNPEDRRSRQEAQMGIKYQGKHKAELKTQGTQTGERVVLHVLYERKDLKTLEQLGMREKMAEKLKGVLNSKGSMVLISSMPQGGFTTTWAASINAADRMLRDFISIENVGTSNPYVENLGVNTFNAAAGETPDTMIPGLMLKQPDAVVVPELHNAETVRMLCVEATEEERVIMAGVHAKESVEALLRVLLLKADAALFAKSITAVVNVRLVRKLCEECKQAFEPPPQLLQKLGIPPGRVQHLYQEWQPPAPGEEKRGQPEVCPKCGGIGYSGRTGIFEFLEVDDRIRQALVSQPKLEVLRQLARQGGNRTLQEEGILLVAQGVTSLNELQRVLKA